MKNELPLSLPITAGREAAEEREDDVLHALTRVRARRCAQTTATTATTATTIQATAATKPITTLKRTQAAISSTAMASSLRPASASEFTHGLPV